MPAIELTAEDGHVLSAHRSEPAGTPTGAVVVVQEIFGVNDHIRAVTDRFNGDRRDDHHPEASAQAWERTIAFLRANLQGDE